MLVPVAEVTPTRGYGMFQTYDPGVVYDSTVDNGSLLSSLVAERKLISDKTVIWPNVAIVSPNGSDTTADGSVERPYATIMSAIGSSGSKTIFLLPGNYTENISINQQDVSIISLNSVVISGKILVSSTGFYLSNTAVRGNGEAALSILSGSGSVTISKSYFSRLDATDDTTISVSGELEGNVSLLQSTWVGNAVNASSQATLFVVSNAGASAGLLTVSSSGDTRVLFVDTIGKVVHQGGSLILDHVNEVIPTSGTSIESTAVDSSTSYLGLSYVNLQQDDHSYGKINKTGSSKYCFTFVNRDPSIDTISGTRVSFGGASDDIAAGYQSQNYSVLNGSLLSHLKGIDAALGTSGVQGSQGPQGADGAQGPQGSSGIQGVQGVQGSTGSQGPQGNQGTPGVQGDTGSQGPQGYQGQTGSGAQGSQGAQGATGTQGPQGFQGISGSGSQGPQGVDGAQGPQGADGTSGSQGAQGLPGSQGVTGAQGPQGSQGLQGNQGSTGNGFLVVANTGERDAIPESSRFEGMSVYSVADGKRFMLQGGVSNNFWISESRYCPDITPPPSVKYSMVDTSGEEVYASSSSTVYSNLTWVRTGTVLRIVNPSHALAVGDRVFVRNVNVDFLIRPVVNVDTNGNYFEIATTDNGGTSGWKAAYGIGFSYAHDISGANKTGGTLTRPSASAGELYLHTLTIRPGASRSDTQYTVHFPSETLPSGLIGSVVGSTTEYILPTFQVRRVDGGIAPYVVVTVVDGNTLAIGGTDENLRINLHF
jgi:hypothetical protein